MSKGRTRGNLGSGIRQQAEDTECIPERRLQGGRGEGSSVSGAEKAAQWYLTGAL